MFLPRMLVQIVGSSIYLDIVTDVDRDFGQGKGHCLVRHLADPGIHLLLRQEFLQSLQRLQMVRHDQDHGGLLLAQSHAQHIDMVDLIIIEVIQSWKTRVKIGESVFPFKNQRSSEDLHRFQHQNASKNFKRLFKRAPLSCNSTFYLSNMLK